MAKSKIKLKAQPLAQKSATKRGELSLRALEFDAITAIMPNQTGDAKFSVDIGQTKDTSSGLLAWSGRDQAFLFGKIDSLKNAYLADISDGWVFYELKGQGAWEVLARLAPIDLRPEVVGAGKSFRTQLGHMQTMIITQEKSYMIGVMSSFANTAHEELLHAMESIEARALNT